MVLVTDFVAGLVCGFAGAILLGALREPLFAEALPLTGVFPLVSLPLADFLAVVLDLTSFPLEAFVAVALFGGAFEDVFLAAVFFADEDFDWVAALMGLNA